MSGGLLSNCRGSTIMASRGREPGVLRIENAGQLPALHEAGTDIALDVLACLDPHWLLVLHPLHRFRAILRTDRDVGALSVLLLDDIRDFVQALARCGQIRLVARADARSRARASLLDLATFGSAGRDQGERIRTVAAGEGRLFQE